ncbi:TetR family transcriptional regulator [Streptomyces rimosus]|uniref:TetR family transcriptional regulator n=1 Tax=Streptomyces rimosus TaxID=1927 RepID=UPI00051896FB|nr:TetR family transcriptional regulator [Streptomyces rimosus]
MAAAAELIIERGCGGASISQITARAGVAAGAVYFHFRSKEGIAHALLGLDLAEGLPPYRGPALQEWSALALLLARRLDSDPTVRAEPLHGAARAGELLAHVQPGAVAELLISAWAGVAGHRTPGTAEQQMRTFLSCCLPGIATPAAAARLEPAPGLALRPGPGPAETAA